MNPSASFLTGISLVLAGACIQGNAAEEADLILHHGKVVTVDDAFSVREAIAISGERILATGDNESILEYQGPESTLIDLDGRMVLPGLIDSHVHSSSAAMTEFDHAIPQMESIPQVLDYIRSRADALEPGQWIHVRQVFITRLKEQRYPTREELDRAAPDHPVNFSTGPDAVLNSLALKRCGIDRDFEVTDGGPGYLERDPETGEPTGLLRGLSRFIDMDRPGNEPTEKDRYRRTLKLFQDYNSVGLTTVSDRNAHSGAIDRYQKMRDNGDLPVRLRLMHAIGSMGLIDEIRQRIRDVAKHPLHRQDPMLRIIGTKVFLDGGMLTGSAYMRKPWGTSEIYGITDPDYRGVLNIPYDRLLPMARTAIESGLQFTAHSVGDGAVHTLLDVYEAINESHPVRDMRPCITHSNFMSREAVHQAAELGVVMDIQPAWLYLDTRTLVRQFGKERLRYFQPLKTLFEAGAIAGGGSDHMQKIGAERAINPYDPFLGMWITLTRQAKWFDGSLHPEERLSREQAIRFYTRNNAFLLFLENQVGSLEPGKKADLIVIDTDLLTCPVDQVKETRVLQTYLNGKLVFQRDENQ